ncbi:C4-dicarboxylate ABC transporter permease [Phaeobacter gallaeciensis]|uniref:C4-dicarboxylate ABC transporter permease n=1 Tax=Phaeobacter gallaeciensis TaxID=60890 RepID=A0A1B0ZS72_9RHOB|nr:MULTISPECIES: TRAP transporter large permease [Phaeobacter]MDF1773182.1 TRAP transporter large permease [Pseudophaeobacter sp. bin_em_oilr2.035]ANP37002.1 C4-dicarboxylate ABC transporter permease [Phaeobacter gallaeciensis]MDE4060884.1 TRAP transporter large permease [Phaeobacter gallaeciensis]MDE4123903.1 TRAP transporter large permease [Phaeobacter gallaeciensis]MDE4128373.1 TRAP transporter large permease [Phaeobacter gallaeciensis]
MTALEIGISSFPILMILIFLRVPIGLSMFLVGLVGLILVTDGTQVAFGRLKSETYSTFSSYSLTIVPMFLLMGHFATLGGMSSALFRAAASFLGHKKGGVAMASIGACAGFGAICGSSLATAATMGRVALPELKEYGYAGGFSTATLAAGGTLGILIPPSVVLVIYAILTEQNIAKLFLAAFIPGILAAVGYVIAISIYVRMFPESAGTRPSVPWAERMENLVKVWPVLLVFGLVVGGIYAGWFTPTEGAAVGAFGTGFIAWLNGGLNRETMVDSFIVTARSTAMIFFIVLGAGFYNGFLALTKVPQELADFVVSQGLSPWMVLALILAFYLVFGCLMDSLSMILLTIPIFFPVISVMDFGLLSLPAMQADAAMEVLRNGVPDGMGAEMLASIQEAIANGMELTREQMKELGIRVTEGRVNRIESEYVAIWFGILVLIVVEVGLITPPVGMNLFIINAMDRTTRMVDTYKAVMFFVASDIIRVIILVAFPIITLLPLMLLH